MSFKAPILRQHSRLKPELRKLADPPQLPRGLSVVLLVVNVILPGVGTMAAGAITDSMDTFLVGALQLLTSIMIFGWLWSVAWGVELVRRSLRRGSSEDDGAGVPGGEGHDAADSDWAPTV